LVSPSYTLGPPYVKKFSPLHYVILTSTQRDPLEIPLAPVTRFKVKRFNEAFN